MSYMPGSNKPKNAKVWSYLETDELQFLFLMSHNVQEEE